MTLPSRRSGFAPNGYCSPSASPLRLDGLDEAVGFFCRTPEDTCLNNRDCGAFERCVYEPSAGRWQCDGSEGPAG